MRVAQKSRKCDACDASGVELQPGTGYYVGEFFCKSCWRGWETTDDDKTHVATTLAESDLVEHAASDQPVAAADVRTESTCSSCGLTMVCRRCPWGRNAHLGEYTRRSLCDICWERWDSDVLVGTVHAMDDLEHVESQREPLRRGRWVAFLLSLQHRADRRRRVGELLRPHQWLLEELHWVGAVNGRSLAIERLVPALLGNTHSEASKNNVGRFAHLANTGLVLNHDWLHMTPGAVGCALSHKAIWEWLVSSGCDGKASMGIGCSTPAWALVLEDDLIWVDPDLRHRLENVVEQLPRGWHICYVGWHGNKVLQLAADFDAAELSPPVRLERWRGFPDPMGTFAYLVSREGAEKLLVEGVVFPLDYQLDAQLNYAFASGGVRAYRCADAGCLFFSAPCQFVDSDVQACWSADHMPALRAYKEAFVRRTRDLDDACVEELAVSMKFSADAAFATLLESAGLQPPRRCVAYAFLDPGDQPSRDGTVAELKVSFEALLLHGQSSISAVLVWYGSDTVFAAAVMRIVTGVFPRCALLFQGPYSDALEAEWPGSGVYGCLAPTLAKFLVLLPLLALCVDELLVVSPSTLFIGDVGRLFSSASGDGTELVATALGRSGSCGSEASLSKSSDDGVAAHDGSFRTVDVDRAPSEDVVRAIFEEVRENPRASYVGLEDARLPPPHDTRCILYRGRSWARVATWVKELLRIFLRIGQSMGAAPPLDILAAIVLEKTGAPLSSGRELGTASSAVHASVAARCVLGLAGVRMALFAEDVAPHQFVALAAGRQQEVEWVSCD